MDLLRVETSTARPACLCQQVLHEERLTVIVPRGFERLLDEVRAQSGLGRVVLEHAARLEGLELRPAVLQRRGLIEVVIDLRQDLLLLS